MAFEENKVLPIITNQKMNDYLKELAELAGIDGPVRSALTKLHLNMPCLAHTLETERLSVMYLRWVFLRK